MKQMNGLDRLFINVETEKLPMDMFGILMLDPSTAPDGHDFARFRAEMAARLPKIPVFTRRAVSAPFGAGHEHWIVDPSFTIDRHLKHLGAPAPHDLAALCELAVSLVDEPLDRGRPLWQMYYVDGLADGSAAILLRLHHAAIDGVGGTEMLSELFDTAPMPRDPELAPAHLAGERVPTQAEMLVRSLPEQMMTPVKLIQRSVPIAVPLAKGLIGRLSGGNRSASAGTADDQPPASEPRPPNSTSRRRNLLNRVAASPKRSLAVASLSMADVKTAKNRFGVTLNDVVLSIVVAAVGDYLRDRGELPDEALRIAGPVNVRDDAAEAASGNHFAFMMVAIPDIADPVERIRAVAALTEKSKPARPRTDETASARTGRKPSGTVGNVMGLIDVLPSGAWQALGQLVNSSAIETVPPIANFVVSNIPGPRDKLYIAGAEITHMYGRTMVGAGIGMFIHCLSYGDTLDFGFTALADLVPDPETIVAGVHRHLSELLDAPVPDSTPPSGQEIEVSTTAQGSSMT